MDVAPAGAHLGPLGVVIVSRLTADDRCGRAEGFYRCCETAEDVLAALAAAARVFSRDLEEVPVRLVVEPDT